MFNRFLSAMISHVNSDVFSDPIADTAVRRSGCRRVATFGSSMQLEGTTLAYWARGGEREWRIFWAAWHQHCDYVWAQWQNDWDEFWANWQLAWERWEDDQLWREFWRNDVAQRRILFLGRGRQQQ